jgi:hypothetical protein
MRENVARGVNCVARNNEWLEQYVVTENDEHKRANAGDTDDLCGRAL